MRPLQPYPCSCAALASRSSPACSGRRGAAPRGKTLRQRLADPPRGRPAPAAGAPPEEAPEDAPAARQPPRRRAPAGRQLVPGAGPVRLRPDRQARCTRAPCAATGSASAGPSTPRASAGCSLRGRAPQRPGVLLNGRRIGRSRTRTSRSRSRPRACGPDRMNELVVVVDNRKERQLPEGWWNWGGIVRPVRLIPAGRAYMKDLGVMSKVRCRGPATACSAKFLVDGHAEARRQGRDQARRSRCLRSPSGRVTKRTSGCAPRAANGAAFACRCVPAPQLWAPERPRLYRRASRWATGVVQQVALTGLRPVSVNGRLALNNRRSTCAAPRSTRTCPGRARR